jgi:hypothetical protein
MEFNFLYYRISVCINYLIIINKQKIMKTVVAFLSFLGGLFNTTLSIFIFCLIDEIEYKPEKAIELSSTMKTVRYNF